MLATRPDAQRGRSAVSYFGLVFLLTVPFLVLGAATGLAILPGLPISALIAVCPAIAAFVLVAVRREAGGVRGFLREAFGAWPRGWWWLPTVLLMPVVMVAAWIAQRVAGVPVPAPSIALTTAVSLTVAFLVAAVAEELGWSAYAIGPLRDRWGALSAGLVIGVVWAAFHVVPLVQASRSWAWIAWWSVGTIALRVILVWVYEHTGRAIIGVCVLHASQNVTWQLYPDRGSFYDPAVTGPITAVTAGIVLLLWRRERTPS